MQDDVIKEGDVVVFYESFETIKFQKMDSSKGFYECRFGKFLHRELIGIKYGTKVRGAKGHLFLLSPTAELWTRGVLHRTQILYVADISMIISNLAILPGSKVLESGTGSGSLSSSIARTVAPHGHLFTFEYNRIRAEMAEQDFAFNGLSEWVTVECRDVVANGFPERDPLITRNGIDAVFLDLPMPWGKVIESSRDLLKIGGHLCSFSPCLEQIQKTCASLYQSGFTVLSVTETLLREYETSSRHVIPFGGGGTKTTNDDDGDRCLIFRPFSSGRGHTGFLLFARKNAVNETSSVPV